MQDQMLFTESDDAPPEYIGQGTVERNGEVVPVDVEASNDLIEGELFTDVSPSTSSLL